jgi:hypothetical protein
LAKKSGISYRVKNIDSVFNAVESIYEDLTTQANELDKIARFTRDRIVAETRKGNDLTNNGAKQPELAEGYIAWRRTLANRGRALERVSKGSQKRKDLELVSRITERTPTPDPTFFRPSKSNLTLTGQLLNSIDYTVKATERKIIIEPTGVRDDGKTNFEVAEELSKRKTRLAPFGRKFLGLDDRGFQRIRNLIVEAIRRLALKKGL